MNAIKPLEHYAIPCGCGSPEPVAVIPQAWETRYAAVSVSPATALRHDITGVYTPQGACTDGEYMYRALVAADDAPTKLQKISLATGEIVLEVTNHVYGHANDLEIVNGELWVLHSSSTATIYRVNPEDLSYIDTFEWATALWGLAYDPVNKLFITGTVGSGYLSVYYSDKTFAYRIKPQNAFYGMVRQGIHADDNYIYVALDNAYGAVIDNDTGSRVMVYTWNGIFIKSVYVPIKEIESIFEKDGYLYIGTYEGRDKNDVKSAYIHKIAFDLYPEQTVITGRPTDVSGGVNNLQRLPEGTPVRLWEGSVKAPGTITLNSFAHGITVTEDAPFRYLRFRFKGANQGVFDWYPADNGVVAIRETDITDAETNTTLRVREMRLTFDQAAQVFTINSNITETFLHTASTGVITVTKTDHTSTTLDPIVLTQIWGVI